MKNTTFRAVALIATALIALLLAAPISFGATNYVLLPAASANQDSGNGADDFHSVMRIQECYGGSLFPQQPIVIRELRFRPSAAVGFAFSTTISNIQINLSTSSSQPEALKRAFDDNVGPDGIVGFKGALPMSSAFSGPAGGPKNFDMVVPLTDAFTFDPRKGNLLIDIINRSGSSASYIDAAGGVGDQCGRAWAYGDYPTNVTYTDATVEAVEVFYEVSPPPPPPPAATYDLARDFSTTSNPNGVWTFGWANIGSPLVPFTYFTHDTAGPATVDVWAKPGGYYPAIEKNNSGVVGTSDGGQGTYPPGSVWFYPGQEGTPQNYGMIRFTTPSGGAGTYHLLSDVRSYLNGPSSGDTDFHILKNGAELFGKFLPPSSAASYSGDLVLASGDIIDFIVGRGADDLLYGSGLFINATLNLTSGGGVAPMIATQPQSQTVTAGANVTLTVTANGTAPLSYQWLFNATSISGATSSSLTISNAQPANAGNYSVRVSNASGSVTSSLARLTVRSGLTCVQSPPGLVGWWPFNNSPNDTQNRFQTTATGNPAYVPGEVATGLHFDAIDDSVQVAANSGLDVGSGPGLTLEAWVNPEDISIQRPIIEWNAGHGNIGLHLWISVFANGGGAGSVWANLVDTTGLSHQLSTGPGVVQPNVFTHLALTYDKGSGLATIYVNGTQALQSHVGTFSPDTRPDLYFGFRVPDVTSPDRWRGVLDEISIYGRALTAAEIAAIYNAYGAGKCGSNPPPPAGTYDLSSDFSTTSNPNGPWTFGSLNSFTSPLEVYTRYTHAPDPASPTVPWDIWSKDAGGYPNIYHNGTTNTGFSDGGQGVYPPGTTWYFPGPEGTPDTYGAVRFTVPADGAGDYQVVTSVKPYLDSGSGDTDFHVLKNHTELFGQFLPGDSSPVTYSNVFNLASGDAIDFLVGRGQDGHLSASGLKIAATVKLLRQVGIPPQITSQPQTISVIQGGTATFTVSASGTTPLTYQWRFNSTDIAGATKSSLTLSNVQPAQAGNYSVRVSNSISSVLSSNASLVVTTPGEQFIILPPSVAIREAGGGSDVLRAVMRVQDVYGASLFPSEALQIHEIRFRPSAVVGGPFSATISNLEINLSTTAAAPERLSSTFADNVGSNDTVVFHGSINLSSGFTGPSVGPKDFDIIIPLTTPFSYDPGAGNLLVDIRDISGSLVTYVDAGGPVGDQAGRAFGYGPAPTTASTVDAGADVVKLIYTPLSGPPSTTTFDLARDFSTTTNPSAPWTFGWEATLGSSLVPFTLFTHDTVGAATVDVWERAGGGYPYIEKNNSGVTGTSEGGQGVYPPGSVWYFPGLEGTDQNYGAVRFTTPSGGSGTYRLLSSVRSYLTGPTSGDTDFHILKNRVEIFGQFLPGSSGTNYSNTLTLASGDTVDFLVGRGADNRLYGSGLFIDATFALLTSGAVGPSIITQPQSQTVTAGANVTFTVAATGTPPLYYQWRFNGAALSGATNPTLLLSNVQSSNAGSYSVTVSNSVTTVVSSDATLTVNRAPPAPTYDLSRDFSTTANPNGAWSYGWQSTLGGSFGLLPYLKTFASDNGVPLADWQLDSTTAPVIARNMGSTTAVSAGGHFTGPPGTVWMNPGFDGRPENFGVIRFKVPAGQPGTYKVETSVRSLFDTDFSADADFHVLKNGTEVFGEFMAPNSSTGYSNVFRLGPSDTIDFAIGRGADGISGNTGLKIQVAVTRVFTGQITIAGLCHLGQFAFTLNADEGANYDIEASEDLVHWTRLTGITNCPASISITDPDSENFPNRFYRATQTE